MATTNNPCCDIVFTCVQCPIITGPDCVPPNNMMPGQLWYNPCTCTYYFECEDGSDPANSCEGLTPLNFKPGAGIQYSGDCENGHFISVKIEPNIGLSFTQTGQLTLNCAQMVDHCNLLQVGDIVFADQDFNTTVNPATGVMTVELDECHAYTRTSLQFNPAHFDKTTANCVDTISVKFPASPATQVGRATEVNSAGVCVGAAPNAYDASNGNSAMLRSRDQGWSYGNGVITAPGAGGSYVAETFTNTTGLPALLEVSLLAQCNCKTSDNDLNVSVSFIHGITTALAVDPPDFGFLNDPVRENFAYTQVDTSTPGFDVGGGGGPGYNQETGQCRYVQMLAPGQSVTLYYQWWVQFYAQFNGKTYFIHGGMATFSKITPNVVQV